MNALTRLIRDPLCHFLVAAVALFAIVGWFGPEQGPGEDSIVVDRDALLTFMQYRMKAFAPEAAAARLDAMGPRERELMIDDYVREQALYREAKATGLGDEDYVMKRRLIQKMEFVANSMAEATVSLDDAQLQAYYTAHREEYKQPPSITFTHLFFDAEKRGQAQARAAAAQAVDRLNSENAGFSDHGAGGDRFPFLKNYVDRTPAFVATHFGEPAGEALFDAQTGKWMGPIESDYGAHAIFVSNRSPGRLPPLAEIHARVAADARRAAIDEAARAVLDATVKQYRVINRLDAREGKPAVSQQAASKTGAAPS